MIFGLVCIILHRVKKIKFHGPNKYTKSFDFFRSDSKIIRLTVCVSINHDFYKAEVMIMGRRIDRRTSKRFKVCEDSFGFITNESKILCKIKNISSSGISLITIENAEHMPESFDTDIFVTGRIFYLKGVPSKKISEFHFDSKSPFTAFVKSRVGIQFGELDSGQAAQLEVFLKNHATIEDVSAL